MLHDVSDDYPEYLDDEYGYAWDAWDVLPANVIERHDAIADASPDHLADVDPAGLDDLDRWAYARACRRHGDPEGFLAAARLIIASEEDHRGLDYADVHNVTVRALIEAELLDEARLLVSQMREQWPDDYRRDQLAVLLAINSGPDEAREVLGEVLERHADDPECLFEIAEDLRRANREDAAVAVLAEVEAAADRVGASAVLVDVRLLRARMGRDDSEE